MLIFYTIHEVIGDICLIFINDLHNCFNFFDARLVFFLELELCVLLESDGLHRTHLIAMPLLNDILWLVYSTLPRRDATIKLRALLQVGNG